MAPVRGLPVALLSPSWVSRSVIAIASHRVVSEA
ncbi:hypothetical protein M2351_003903 [Azospirillum canadense]|nr:hypothetical protein [Azospirillum canadense]